MVQPSPGGALLAHGEKAVQAALMLSENSICPECTSAIQMGRGMACSAVQPCQLGRPQPASLTH